MAIRLAREKFGKTDSILSEESQLQYKKDFYSDSKNKLFKIGQFVLADIAISKNLRKGHNLKRAEIAQIRDIDWSARPVLFTLQSFSEKRILPIKFYREQLKVLIGNPKKLDHRFQSILGQRESRNASLEVKLLMPDGRFKWEKIDDLLMKP